MLNLLRRIVQTVAAAETFEAALEIIVDQIQQAMHTEVVAIYLLDHRHHHYVLAAACGLNADAVGHAILPVTEGLVGQVGLREEPINLEDGSAHPNFFYLKETGEERYKAFLAAPITHRGRVLGVIVVQQRQRRKFKQSEEAFLVTLSAQLAGIVAHAEATGRLSFLLRTPEKTVRLPGVAGATGIGIGQAVLNQPLIAFETVPDRKIEPSEVASELQRLDNAIEQVQQDIQSLRERVVKQLSNDEVALFDVYARLLEDGLLRGGIEARIREGFQADGAVARVVNRHIRRFDEMEDAYLRERVLDVKDIASRILSVLQFKTPSCGALPEKAVLIGDEITTTCLMEFPRENIAAVVTRQGSLNSHMAIVARSLGIPTVVGVVDLVVSQLLDSELIVDGYVGEVLWRYPDRIRRAYLALMDEERVLLSGFDVLRDAPAQTADGVSLDIWLNTGLTAEAVNGLDACLAGVGLHRSEIPFLIKDRFPTEAEQISLYRKHLEAFAPKPVTIRTLDIGGDKVLPYFPIREDNPFLGWRGIRISLDHPEIFVVQIRAMLSASETLNNLRILLPMVSTVQEVLEAKKIVNRAYEEVRAEGRDVVMPPLGIMVEVPAAALQVASLAKHVDFISVGTNDLIQYVLAVDRNNPRVADLYDPYHPVVLQLLHTIADQAAVEGTQVSVCGEMAGEPALAILLVAMGYRHLSMSVSNVARVKWALRQVSLPQAAVLLEKVRALDAPGSIRGFLLDALSEVGMADFMRLTRCRNASVL
jgi:phosphotransferase system enzyme I (PtsP)